MQYVATVDPFELLLDLEQRSMRAAVPLPRQEDVKAYWSGIGFRLGRQRLLAPVGEVQEILTMPALTKVPLSQGWVLGIANVRGNLLAVIDLQAFVLGKPVALNRASRLLVASHRGVSVGLLVEEVTGLRHFLDEERTSMLSSVDSRIRGYLERAYWQDGEYWGVFSAHKLLEDPRFLQVAA